MSTGLRARHHGYPLSIDPRGVPAPCASMHEVEVALRPRFRRKSIHALPGAQAVFSAPTIILSPR